MLKRIRTSFAKLRRDESGATLVEYGIALFIAIAVGGAALNGLGTTTQGNFTSANTVASQTPTP
ncbi:Flp family type IVb pilin [Ruegeria sp.]|uniref:Flp family type IVb pilin n=1 Tax=Ruegeria sp. TaxID=1879320 RepID=UPI003B5CABC5